MGLLATFWQCAKKVDAGLKCQHHLGNWRKHGGLPKQLQKRAYSYSPFNLNTVPSPEDSGVTPFVITYSATAVEAAKLEKTSFNKLKAKHPNILYKRCVTAFKRGPNLRDLLVRSRLGKAHWKTQRLPDPTQVRI